MFVQSNSLRKIKDYFHKELPDFSKTEVNLIVKALTCKYLGLNDSEYILAADRLLSESDLIYFHRVLKQLQNNEPFQYILGNVEFYGLQLKIDYRALIPRPETEELVDWVVSTMKEKESPVVMDLCSGSGCIALAIKSKLKSANVYAVELYKDAVDLINENMALTNLDIVVKEMDVLDFESYKIFGTNKFDCWVCNPPYIPAGEMDMMDKNVIDHEPHLALFVDDSDPFVFYKAVATQAKHYLVDSGYLFFEIHEDYKKQVVALLEESDFVNIELRKDLQGRDRMVKAQSVFSQHESQ